MKKFIKEDSGVGTLMALFWFVLCAGIVGLSVDASNAWRQKERLQLAADTASHAGALAALGGGSASQIRAAAKTSALSNMPESGFGRVIEDDYSDIVLSYWDWSTNELTEPSSEINAVTVQLHRDNAVDNPVATYMLQFVGFTGWQVRKHGTTVTADFQKCPNYEGVFAHGKITSSSLNFIGQDYCLHSQDFVWMPQQNTFAAGSYVGMPSLLDCEDKCVDTANPGVEDAKHEINLQMPDFGARILDIKAAMLSDDPNEVKTDFWNGKAVDQTKLAPLVALGYLPDPSAEGYTAPATGDVIWNMSEADFEALEEIPPGLTYEVDCTANGNGPATRITMGTTASGNPVRDIALITNCSIEFLENTDWRGVLVLTDRVQNTPSVTASESSTIGDPTQGCYFPEHSYVFAMSDMTVPAKFAGSNVTIMVDGDVHIASGSSAISDSKGMSIYASGEVDLTTQHRLEACGYPTGVELIGDGFKYIRQIIASNEYQTLAAAR